MQKSYQKMQNSYMTTQLNQRPFPSPFPKKKYRHIFKKELTLYVLINKGKNTF